MACQTQITARNHLNELRHCSALVRLAEAVSADLQDQGHPRCLDVVLARLTCALRLMLHSIR